MGAKASRNAMNRVGMSARSLARALVVPALALAVASASHRDARAQTISPSQVTPRDLRPAASPAGGVELPAAAGLTAPPGADKLPLSLGRVGIEGGFDELAGAGAAATNALTGGPVTVADVYRVANELERAYAAAGYVLARVVVPPQKLEKGGALRLVVVDGFIESVDVSRLPASQRAWIAARMAPLVGLRHVTLGEIERRLLLASDDPGLRLRSTLVAGGVTGAARLVLEGTYDPVTGSIGVDNHLPASLGVYSLNASVAINGVLGFGEQIYATGSSGWRVGEIGGPNAPLELFGGGVSLPLGTDGFVVNPEYTRSVSRPFPTAGSPASVGYFDRFDLRASYPIARTRAQSLVVQGALEWDEEYLSPIGFGTDLYRDNYGVARLQADEALQLPWAAAAEAIGAVSQGLGGRDGADATASAIPLSRQGASADFTKADLTLRYTQALPEAFQLALIARGQSSFGKPLFISEAFSLDGPDAVSGFASGTFSVDEGALARVELGRALAIPAGPALATIAPYVFAAGGRGFIDDATAAQQAAIEATSFGLGARTGVDLAGQPFGTSLTLEAARFQSNVAGERAGWRGNVSFQIRF